MNLPKTSPLELLKTVRLLGDAYPSFPLSSATIDVYVRLLADLPADLLEQAALDHISRSAFFPTVAELRSAAFDLLAAAHPSPSAQEAWLAVLAEVERVGHAGQPQFADPLAQQAVGALGWRSLCLSENPVSERAHFVQVYQALRAGQQQEARRLPEVRRFLALQAGSSVAALTDPTH